MTPEQRARLERWAAATWPGYAGVAADWEIAHESMFSSKDAIVAHARRALAPTKEEA